jgi:hypothetical protein
MTIKTLLTLTAACGLAFTSADAGQQISSGDKKVTTPVEKTTWFPDDPYLQLITFGGIFSQHLSGLDIDSIFGVYANQERDAFFFYDSRTHAEDNGETFDSNGLAFRKKLPGRDVILGVNAFYDQVDDSPHDNNYNGLGLGAEVLTRWVDWRFNYYLPEDKEFEVDRSNRRDSETFLRPAFLVQRNHVRTFKTFEAPLEGLDTEIGFLIPGLDKHMEVRVFGGYHHFVNPFGKDYEGFQARLEARLLRGVIADVEYWDDTRLMGGHWSAGVRVALPFNLLALAHGHNPFAGWQDEFKPGPRPFEERMGEMIIRQPRLHTTTSGGIKVRDKVEEFARPVGGPGQPVVPAGVPFE